MPRNEPFLFPSAQPDQDRAGQRHEDYVRAISEVTAHLDAALEDAIHGVVCVEAMRVFGGQSAALWIFDGNAGELLASGALSEKGPARLPDDLSVNEYEHPVVSVWRSGEAAVTSAPVTPPTSKDAETSQQSLLIPFLTPGGNSSLGVALVRRPKTAPPFGPLELQLARVFSGLVSPRLATEVAAASPSTSAGSDPQLIEAMPDAVLVIGANSRVATMNHAAVELLGLEKSQVVGRFVQEIDWPLVDLSGQPIPSDRLPWLSVARDHAAVSNFEVLIAGPQVKNATVDARPISQAGGKPRGTVVVMRDSSEHHELLRQLTRTETMRTVGQLASAAIHDINNWFGLILGQADMLLVSDPPADQAEALESIRQAASDGAEALKRIQDLARTSPGTDPLPLDINQVLREVVDITRPRWSDHSQASGASVSVLLDLTNALPMVAGHASELREVFTNLVLNAVDALPHGGTIKISSRKQRSRVVVSVSDTGTGMTEEVKQRLFEPFFTTKGARGSGLGLSVSREMVERHGGRMAVDSALGKGTTFTLSFRTMERAAVKPDPANVPPPPPSRILVVEDEPHMRDLLVRMLERDRHTVHACRSGREAIQLLGGEAFDLVLTDLVMPGVDGWEVAQAARKAQPNLPVVMVTGTSQRHTESELRARGIDAKLNKPFHLQQLRRVLSGSLKSREEATLPEPMNDRPRMLAVDDEPAMLKMITAMLATSGCDLDTAESGGEALRLLRDAHESGKPFDLIFTDMRMPDMNGAEVVRQARELNPRIVTVLLSGDISDQDGGGADLTLQKPYSLATLLDTLDEALALRARATGRSG